MQKPKIKITVIGRKGPCGCHRGHKPGDSFDFDTERGKLCPMAMHVAFPYIDILRYGGSIPGAEPGTIDILRYGGSIPGAEPGTAVFCCPDVDTINVFKVEVVKEQ